MSKAIIEISLGKSSSPNYKKARTYLLGIPLSNEDSDGNIGCKICSIEDYIENQLSIIRFLQIASDWKQTEILLYDTAYDGTDKFYYFAEKLKSNYPKYERAIRQHIDDDFVAMGDITYERNLPMPFVHYPDLYGAFIAFSDSIDGQIYFCECQKDVIGEVIKARHDFDDNNDEWAKTHRMDGFPPELSILIPYWGDENIIARLNFAKGICFCCNKTKPALDWCHSMYGGAFKRQYGWYIAERTKDYHLKINNGTKIGEDSPEIHDDIRRVRAIINELSGYDSRNNSEKYHECFKRYERAKRQLDSNIENSVRNDFGYRKIGDAWVSETILSEIVKNLYPDSTIKRHYRPVWLDRLELDIFLPEENLAFEYQGIQHFKAIKHWGGEEKLKEQQEHDHRKARICAEKGIKLIHINYDEPLDAEYIKTKIIETKS